MQIGQWILRKNGEENSVSVEDKYRSERLRNIVERFYRTFFLVSFSTLH